MNLDLSLNVLSPIFNKSTSCGAALLESIIVLGRCAQSYCNYRLTITPAAYSLSEWSQRS